MSPLHLSYCRSLCLYDNDGKSEEKSQDDEQKKEEDSRQVSCCPCTALLQSMYCMLPQEGHDTELRGVAI